MKWQGHSRLGGVMLLASFLAACSGAQWSPGTFLYGNAPKKQTAQYRLVSTSQAWLKVPSNYLVLRKSEPGAVRQIIDLPNSTSLRGDNYFLLVARALGPGRSDRLKLTTVQKEVGANLTPFSGLTEANLMSRQDGAGVLFWEQKLMGSDSCVIAFRRYDSSQIVVPARGDVLDVIMRNCVAGDYAKALAPITSANLNIVPLSNARSIRPERDFLSPLAAPMTKVPGE